MNFGLSAGKHFNLQQSNELLNTLQGLRRFSWWNLPLLGGSRWSSRGARHLGRPNSSHHGGHGGSPVPAGPPKKRTSPDWGTFSMRRAEFRSGKNHDKPVIRKNDGKTIGDFCRAKFPKIYLCWLQNGVFHPSQQKRYDISTVDPPWMFIEHLMPSILFRSFQTAA